MFPHTIFLSEDRNVDDDIDLIFNIVNNLVKAEQWDTISDYFQAIVEKDYYKQTQTHGAQLMAFLATTRMFKKEIGHWRKVMKKKVKKLFKKENKNITEKIVEEI